MNETIKSNKENGLLKTKKKRMLKKICGIVCAIICFMIPIKSLANHEELNNSANKISLLGNITYTTCDSRFLNIHNEQNYIYEYLEQKKQAKREELLKNASTMYVIADKGLNIRNENLEIIGAIPLNTKVTVLKDSILMTEDGSYNLILYKDQYAYAFNKFLSKEQKVIEPKIVQVPEGKKSSATGKYLGKFTTTAYCNCSRCCGKWAGGPTASGTMPRAGRTIAVDPKVIPLGTKVIINGNTYVAEDTGSAIKGNKIDIYHDSHSSALSWGRRTVDVYLAS